MTDAPEEALKPCPRGHTKTSRDNNNVYGTWWVKCADGECSWRAAGDTESEAIAAWNTRSQPAETASGEVVERLRGLSCVMVEICEPHPGNPSPNIIPVVRADLIATLTPPDRDAGAGNALADELERYAERADSPTFRDTLRKAATALRQQATDRESIRADVIDDIGAIRDATMGDVLGFRMAVLKLLESYKARSIPVGGDNAALS